MGCIIPPQWRGDRGVRDSVGVNYSTDTTCIFGDRLPIEVFGEGGRRMK